VEDVRPYAGFHFIPNAHLPDARCEGIAPPSRNQQEDSQWR
jgi:hypothetical protein